MDFSLSLDHIVDTLKHAKNQDRGCTLLIGAGCSVTAGIPAGAGLVKEIEEHWPAFVNQLPKEKRTYFACMGKLFPAQRRDLIAGYVDRAKINWVHICIALLIKEGYVDRVLTTNFDRLVVQACALLGEFPAVYDFAASQMLKKPDIPDKAVFYLHGQRTGFILIITEEDANKHFRRLAPVFKEALEGRVCIVVGYSGLNDPVFNHLAEVECFENGIYWVVNGNKEPAKHVQEKLLVQGKNAYYVSGFDSDSFFIRLTQELKIFPPDLIARPFTHLNHCFESLTPYYPIPGQDAEEDVTRLPRQWVQSAIKKYEQGSPGRSKKAEADSLLAQAQALLMSGDYAGVVALRPQYEDAPAPALADTLSRAYLDQGNALADQARTKTGQEADRLFTLAGEKYAAALQIKPDKHEALYNWGIALYYQGKNKTGEEADHLFNMAGEKYAAALQIKPDMHEALNNWGYALDEQAKTKTGEEADRLFTLAGEKYAAALKIKPDKHGALNNWGLALAAQARTKTGEEADRLLTLAGEKYAAVLQIKPDDHEALNNWGNALILQSKTKSGPEAAQLLERCIDILSRAEEIKPGSGAYNLACAAALRGDAEGCRQWLGKCQESGTLPDKKHLQEDPDLERVRELDWFKELLASLS